MLSNSSPPLPDPYRKLRKPWGSAASSISAISLKSKPAWPLRHTGKSTSETAANSRNCYILNLTRFLSGRNTIFKSEYMIFEDCWQPEPGSRKMEPAAYAVQAQTAGFLLFLLTGAKCLTPPAYNGRGGPGRWRHSLPAPVLSVY